MIAPVIVYFIIAAAWTQAKRGSVSSEIYKSPRRAPDVAEPKMRRMGWFRILVPLGIGVGFAAGGGWIPAAGCALLSAVIFWMDRNMARRNAEGE